MAMNYFVVDTLSTVRAYVGAEAFWSKGQKDAIYFLSRYTITHNEKEYQLYLQNLTVPLGDRVARLELQKENTNFNIVREAFRKGQNHPDDIMAMALLFKRFHNLSYLKKSIELWTQGDAEIKNLQNIADEIHALVLNKKFTPELSNHYIATIDEINNRLTVLEGDYSKTLGEAARWLSSTLFQLTFLIALLCLIFSLWLAFSIGRKILKRIEILKAGTIRIEQGNLTERIESLDIIANSRDELTELAISFNKMTESLSRAIDERNLAQERLEIRARQLSEAQELAHIGDWEWDILKAEMNASEEYYNITGIDFREKLTYDVLIEKVPPLERELVNNTYAKVLQNKLPFQLDHQIIIPNGEIRMLNVQGRPVIDEEGNLVKIIGCTQDVTDRLKIQSQLVQSSKMASLGEMASGIAHEINNPLTIIKLAATQLQKNVETDPNASPSSINCILKIDSTVDRISKIIQGLRAFSRDGKDDKFEKVILGELVEDILSFCSERLKHHSIKLIKENISSEMIFEARQIEISQVILNLLNNAFDANDTESISDKWIKISAADSKDFLDIRITDSGKGIAPELQAKIFQPFFTSKEIGKGTGLGLSLSMTIVKNHNGDLFLDTANKNTSFVVRLPKKQHEFLNHGAKVT
jgi:signal transduction histidine kinase